MNTTRQHGGRAALGILFGLLGLASCGAQDQPGGTTTAQASAPAPAPASAPAPSADSPAPGIEKLDTGYDASKLNSRQDTATGSTQLNEAARRKQPTGLQPPSISRNGGIGIDDGGDLFDFGVIRQGEARQHTFDMVSNGTEPLVITGVKPSCGCTKAEISLLGENGEAQPYERNTQIPVGTPFQLLVEVSTDGKPAGPFAAQVSLYSNSPSAVMSVRLQAEIEPILLIEPSPTVYFGRMTTADKAEQTLKVSSKQGEPFLMTLVQDSYAPFSDYLAVEYSPVEPDAQGRAAVWDVKVTLGPDTPMGMRNCPLRFSTDIPIAHPRYETPDGSIPTHLAQLYVQAQVTGMVHADPAFVSFGLVRPGEVVERSVRIECHDDFQLSTDIPCTVEGLQGQPFPYADAISTSLESVEEGRVLELKIRLEGLPDDVNGSFGGILQIAVGHPYLPVLSVRLSGVCRPGLPGGSGN